MRSVTLRLISLMVVAGAATSAAFGQHPDGNLAVFVDQSGVMRWNHSGAELAFFGVNYNTPFAFGYRAHGYLQVDRKHAIDADVSHLARLGLDAFRIHVWDREISDREGNLIENDHLDLLDYLLARLHEHHFKTILTPIAWWPPGYPEPPPESDGFSNEYTKSEMSVDPEALRAQENYLKQFVAHVNPYTGHSYRDDPDIIAFELFNEPSHPSGPEATTRFIDHLAGALRVVDVRKPIFYNISQGYSEEHGKAVCAAEIQGVSVQWYPTGLVRGSTVQGNMLPNVDSYPLPFEDFADCRGKARMVYEFDAADVSGTYLYPAMARAFRSAGFQWATQFAYDPLALASSNTEYQTHFLNLVYTPSKAISFLIAGAAFRALPRGGAYGTYPDSEQFGPFRISFAEDLSEMVTDTAFYYSNSTNTLPPNAATLERVAGIGTSEVVSYTGTGAYFLDRINSGSWRLEVYPDAIAVKDPFSRPSLKRHAVRVINRAHPMRISLPDLGPDFSVEPVNEGNEHAPAVKDGSFHVRPGVYLLARRGAAAGARAVAETTYGDDFRAFYVPDPLGDPTEVVHTPPAAIVAGNPYTLTATVVSTHPVDSVSLFIRRRGSPGRMGRTAMEAATPFSYEATVSEAQLQPGLISYVIAVYENGRSKAFPGGDDGDPHTWDYTGVSDWTVPVVAGDMPIAIFDARRDAENMLVPSFWEYVPFALELVGGSMPDRFALRAVARDLTPPPHHLGLRTFLSDDQRALLRDELEGDVLRIRARATGEGPTRMEVALVGRDGAAWGTVISLTETWADIDVPVGDLRRVPLTLLPRPYPHFLPYTLMASVQTHAPNLTALDGLQLGIGAAHVADPKTPHGFEIEHVYLTNSPGVSRR